MGGDEAGRALEDVLCKLAADATHGDEWTTSDILQALSGAETLDLVLPYECRDEKKALGKKLAKLRGMELIDTRGRRFEFGRRDAGVSARYPVRFLDAADQ
jgi:RNA-binding protein YhbY